MMMMMMINKDDDDYDDSDDDNNDDNDDDNNDSDDNADICYSKTVDFFFLPLGYRQCTTFTVQHSFSLYNSSGCKR